MSSSGGPEHHKPTVSPANLLIVRKIGEGASEHDLLDAYPGLTLEGIRAALVYAADTLVVEPGRVKISGPTDEG